MSLMLILTPFFSALEINILEQSYDPQETLQAEITGNFLTLGSKNIFIYRHGIPRPMPVISDLMLKNDIYYFYAILPRTEGNYSLKIEDAEYLVEGKIKTERIIHCSGDSLQPFFRIGDIFPDKCRAVRFIGIDPGIPIIIVYTDRALRLAGDSRILKTGRKRQTGFFW